MKKNFPSEDQFQRAVDVVRGGGVIAFPTETYYGLGVDINNDTGLKALYQLKQRATHKPLLVLIDDVLKLKDIVAEVPPPYEEIIRRFWPGPLTLIFPSAPWLLPTLVGLGKTVGVRISPNPVAMQLCRKLGKPVTATSANISGHSPARTKEKVLEVFGDAIDYILDGGETAGGECSTVVGLDNHKLKLIRPGQINFSTIISN